DGRAGACSAGACVDPVFTFTAVTPAASTPVLSLGTIPARAGLRVHIRRIGICGDADATSGLQGFRAYATGLDFTWGAGQANQSGVTQFLSPTPATVGSGRGFSYRDVSYYGPVGGAVNIDFQYRNDWDGRFCQAADELGTNYLDAASTARAWVRYSYVP
ncbi:hypothetical protein L6R52_05010, partial [Myxococcota bacterium]|nr:hypothetical protein [Myxococcota bacterium]